MSPARRALLLASSIFAVLLAFSSPVRAQQTSSPRRAVLLLLPRVAAEPFLEELDTPRWRRLRTGSALALVNPVVPGPDTRLSAGLTLGAGRRLEYPPGAAAPYAAPGSGSAWKVEPENVYARAAMGGAALIPLGQACRQAGLRVAYGGAADAGGRLQGAGLLGAMDSEQRIPEAAALPRAGDMVLWLRQSLRLLEAGASSPRLLILDLPEGRTTAEGLFLADALSRALDPERDLLLLTSLDPGPAPGGQWQALAPALLWGRAWAGRWATTTTTRMDGLLANVDLAPTLLAHLGLPSVPAMEGHPARPGAVGDAEGLRRLARHTSATHQAMVPGLLAWGGFAIASLGFALLALLRRWTGTRLAVGRVLLATTAAFLPATLLAVPGVLSGPLDSAAALLLRVAALTLCLAALASVIGWTASPFLAALLFTTLLLLLDLFSGGRLLALNLVSDFPYIGARFYGIGNEYMGLLLGATLVIPFWLEHLRGRNRLSAPGWAGAVALWTVSLVGVGAPQWGADFGGAVSLAIAYLTAGALALPARAGGKPAVLGRLVGGLVIVGAVAAAFVAVDLLRPPEVRTHVGELAARALGGDGGGVVEMALRKARLNLRMATSGYFVGGVLAVAPFFYVWYHRLGPAAWRVLAERPLMKAAVLSTSLGGLAALLLNDTGVVAWAMAVGCGLLAWLDLLLSQAPLSPKADAG